MGRMEVSSVNESPQHEHACNQISDCITHSGFRSCTDGRYETEAPPPGYEEVMRVSQEAVYLRIFPNQQHVTMYILS